MKTIDLNFKEWFDKVNGNSYFAGIITIDYGMESEQEIKIPFTYGYDNQFEWESLYLLVKIGLISNKDYPLSRYCRENNIIFRSNMQRNCKQRELKNI